MGQIKEMMPEVIRLQEEIDMLYSPDFGFSFVHIPKCAGNSLKRELEPIAYFPGETIANDAADDNLSSLPGEHVLCSEHDQLGKIHLAHIPLPFLRDYFPQTFALLKQSDAFAVVRDPRDRFVSALMQRLREFKKIGATRVTPEKIREEAEEVCAWLAGRELFCDLEYIHFTRQTDYIYCDGEQIVKRVFAIEHLEDARSWLERKHDVPPFAIQQQNSSIRPAGWYRHLHKYAVPVYQGIVPKPVREKIFPVLRNSFLFSSKASSHDTIDLGKKTEAFIENYYRRDRELYTAVV